MTVVELRIVQPVNFTPGVDAMGSIELVRRLQALRVAINAELASRGCAIMELAYLPSKDTYYYFVSSLYDEENYPVIKGVVEKCCS